jgi:hypothetical protein
VPPIWQDYLLKALVPYSAVVWVAILASLIAQIIFGVFVRKVEINMKLEIDFSPFKVNKRQKLLEQSKLLAYRHFGTTLLIRPTNLLMIYLFITKPVQVNMVRLVPPRVWIAIMGQKLGSFS